VLNIVALSNYKCLASRTVFFQILAGASCFYAFYDVYVELLGAGTSGGNHVTRRHLVTPSAVTVAVLVVATLGVTSTTTLTSPFPQSNWTSGAPMAESFDLSGVAWTKYYISAVAIVSLLPAAILQVYLVQTKIINPLMGILEPPCNGPLCSNAVIGTPAIDCWALTFGTARRGLGGLRPRPVPSSLYQM